MSNYIHGYVTPHRTVAVTIHCVLDKKVDVDEFINECEYYFIDSDTGESYSGLADTTLVGHEIILED